MIRPATRADLPGLAAMIVQMSRFHQDEPRIDTGRLEADLLGAEPWAFALVAERLGELVGYVILYRLYLGQYAQRGMELHHLYVAEAARGTGLGRRLVEAARVRAQELGCSYIALGAIARNTQAHRFYEAFGFERLPASSECRFRLNLNG